MNTRFNNDSARTIKRLEISTEESRYYMNAPGPGDRPDFIPDPQFRLQKWGANLYTNSCDLESDLRGMSRQLNHDEVERNDYQRFAATKTTTSNMLRGPSERIRSYGEGGIYVDESRATHPAWELRCMESNHFQQPLLIDPLENREMRFVSNLNTRILERDYHLTTVQPLQLNGFGGASGR